MDFGEKGVLFSNHRQSKKSNGSGDITLSLNFDAGKNHSSLWRSKGGMAEAHEDSFELVLGLGPTPNTYSHEYITPEINRKKQAEAEHHKLSLAGDSTPTLRLCLSGQAEERITGHQVPSPPEAAVTVSCVSSLASGWGSRIPVVDEGSTSAKKSGGYMPSLLLAPRMDSGKTKSLPQAQELFEIGGCSYIHTSDVSLSTGPSAATDFSIGTFSEDASAGASLDQKAVSSKKCKFVGCRKGARGASGLCIGHGGGQRCQKPGCSKGAESRTAYCKSHGGGRRCEKLGCTKSAEGKTDYCIAHGGGRRCGYPGGCTKASRGKSGLCIKHGGGKRCKIEGCTRSAEGQAGLCISHGGGRRCQFEGCSKGAQGSTQFCKAHGGGKRCVFMGCTKGAEGSTPLCKAHGGGKRCLHDGGGICSKSVHGGTNFCVAHGGGKRCSVTGCTKSARGRTDCCVKHGGGKRCHVPLCGKSAQGSTDFCKAHGGGKRCVWGGAGKCEKFARGRSGLCAAHSTLVQHGQSKNSTMIAANIFHGIVAASSAAAASVDNNASSSAASIVSDCSDSSRQPPKRQCLIPPQVLVPLSMKSSASAPSQLPSPLSNPNRNASSSGFGLVVPEGRVHGGGLMSLFRGNLNNAAIDSI
uniref:WRKY19-like zinc finger domain-containing protein n=1 Tax=Kalanchoe fedtschenkoi TaxID=63787 RepID=A0A7N0TW32_KALFE